MLATAFVAAVTARAVFFSLSCTVGQYVSGTECERHCTRALTRETSLPGWGGQGAHCCQGVIVALKPGKICEHAPLPICQIGRGDSVLPLSIRFLQLGHCLPACLTCRWQGGGGATDNAIATRNRVWSVAMTEGNQRDSKHCSGTKRSVLRTSLKVIAKVSASD